MAEPFDIFNNPWEDSMSPRDQTSATEDPPPGVKKTEQEELGLTKGGASEVLKRENDSAEEKGIPDATDTIAGSLVCEQFQKGSQTELDKPQQENRLTEALTLQTTKLDRPKEVDSKLSEENETLIAISAAVQTMGLEQESDRLGEEESDTGNTEINRLKHENDTLREENYKLQIENQNLTEKMQREVEESQNLRKELEIVQEQLQQTLSNKRSVSLSTPSQTKPAFGVPTPLSSPFASIPPFTSIPPTAFGTYIGTRPLPFDASTKSTTSLSDFTAALKALVGEGVSSKKSWDNTFTTISSLSGNKDSANPFTATSSLSENKTTTPAITLSSSTSDATGDSPIDEKKPAASVASSTAATNGSVASSRSSETYPTATFRDKPGERTPS
jgi:hypothetical protein